MATTKKTSIKKTTSKKVVNDKLSSSKQEDTLLKKNGIDEMSIDDLIKFAKKAKVDIPDVTDESERVNIVLPLLAHFAQKEDLLLGFGVLDNFIKKYPKNFINVGVAEQNMIGVATGLSKKGFNISKLQTGYLYHYTFVMLVGLTFILGLRQF